MIDKFSFLGNAEVNQTEALFEQYIKNPASVESSWRSFFEGFEFAQKQYPLLNGNQKSTGKFSEDQLKKEFNVINLINGYRNRGHLFTKTNPVRERRKYSPTL